MLPKLPPLKYLVISSVISFLAISVSLFSVLELPRIGIELRADSDSQLVISNVFPGSPAMEAGIKAGSVLTGISKDGVSFLSLDSVAVIQDPDVLATFQDLNGFISFIQNVNQIAAANSFYLRLDNDITILITRTDNRQLGWLPGWYWWMLGLATFIFLLAASILGHKPTNRSGQHLFVTGIGLWCASVAYTVYGCRELAGVSASIFYTLIALKHISLGIFAWGGTTLIWQYPTKKKTGILYWAYSFLLIFIWGCNSFQVIEFPIHTYYFIPYLFPTTVGIYFTLKQYQSARSSPIDKAIMLWICSAIWVSVLTIYLLHILPVLYHQEPISNLVVQFMFSCLFVGFGFGVTKYRLFDIDRWWFNTWLIFFLGISILSVDAMLVYLWKINKQDAFSIALLLSFWIYFPLRERLWRFLFKKKRTYEVNDYLAEFVTLFSSSAEVADHNEKHKKLFSLIFKPSSIEVIANIGHTTLKPKIRKNGLELSIPIDPSKTLHLSGKDFGNHLFDSNDRGFSETAMSLARKVVEMSIREKQAEANERARIMRDLHDDVGSQLLHLIHGSTDAKAVSRAQDILSSLRLSVIPLHDNKSRKVSDSIDVWVFDIRERLLDVNIAFADFIQIEIDAYLGVREYINVTRILRELTTNLIKHSYTTSVSVAFSYQGEYLKVRYDQISNDCEPSSFLAGTGLNNIDSRIHEIEGCIDVSKLSIDNNPTLRYTLLIPLEEHLNAQ